MHLVCFSGSQADGRGPGQHLRHEGAEEGHDRAQPEGHGAHQGRAQHPGGGQAPVHRRPHLRLPDQGQALPHPGVPLRRGAVHAPGAGGDLPRGHGLLLRGGDHPGAGAPAQTRHHLQVEEFFSFFCC